MWSTVGQHLGFLFLLEGRYYCCLSCVPRRLQGSFKDTTPDVLLAEVLSAVLARTGVDPADVGEVRGSGRLQPRRYCCAYVTAAVCWYHVPGSTGV